jgi:YfiH family protein
MNRELDGAATIIQAEALSSIPWLVHAVTTRRFNSTAENRSEDLQRLAALLRIQPAAIAWCDQVHEDAIALLADTEPSGSASADRQPLLHLFPHTDAIITNLPAVMINVFTADCIPILIADTERKIIAVVHAGWKGTLLGILGKTIQTLRYLRSDPRDLFVWLGPAIGRCCYEVSAELVAEFQQRFPDFAGYYEGRNLDLIKLNILQAQRAGALPERISFSDVCTLCRQDLFFSYRGDAENCGRMISTMMIRNDEPRNEHGI